MPYNTYYASATQAGRNHAGTLSDPFSPDDFFGVRSDSYYSKLVRPCVVYLLPGGTFYSTNCSTDPSIFMSDNGESSFFTMGSEGLSGPIVVSGYNPESYQTLSDYPKIANIKTSINDIPIYFNDICFYNGTGAPIVASGGTCQFVNCLFISQSSSTIHPIFTCLSRHGGHTLFMGCYVKAAPSSHASGEKICSLLAGYFDFFACWFDTWAVPIEGEDDACYYESCVFRQMDPAPQQSVRAFPYCHSTDIKRCLFWRFGNAIEEALWTDYSNPTRPPISRVILFNNLFYECGVPYTFNLFNQNAKIAPKIVGNVYYNASVFFEAYLSHLNTTIFPGNIQNMFRKYTGQGNPLGEGRPVMYMNSEWPWPQNPTQYQMENSPDETLAGISAYDLHSYSLPEKIVRVGVVEDGKIIRVPFRVSPNFLPSPIGTWPDRELVIQGAVSYGAYDEMTGTYREPNPDYVLSAHEYGPPGANARTGRFIPATDVRLDCRSIHFSEPPTE